MVSSLRVTVEPWEHMESCGEDANDESSNPGMIFRTARSHFSNYCLIFVLWIWVSRWSQGGCWIWGCPKWTGLCCLFKGLFLLVLPCLGKRFCRTRKMTWWMIPHRSSYLMKAWVAKESLRQLTLHLRGWTENLFNLHQKGHVKLNWIYLFPLKFEWLRHDACQCWWHHRSLEARSRTSILQKTKLGHKNFN